MAGRRSTSETIVSKAALSRPITIAARSVVTGTEVDSSRRPVSRRLRRGAPAAAQLRREVGRVVAKAAEVDELSHAGLLGRLGRGLGRLQVALLEVGRAE